MSAANKHIQPGYTTITPYLYAKLDLVDFLKNAFGAEVTHTPTPDAEGKFHAEAKIGDAHLLFGNGFFFRSFDGGGDLSLRSRCRCDLQTRGESRRQGGQRTGRYDLG